MAATDLSSLVGYCGLYCNACGIRQQKIRTAANNLRGIIAAYGFDKVMDGLVKLFGDCPSCLQGGGDPNCKVRSCAKQKGYRTCAECAEVETCENLAPMRKGYKGFTQALQNIRQNGINKYAEEMQKKVAKGYSYLEERQ